MDRKFFYIMFGIGLIFIFSLGVLILSLAHVERTQEDSTWCENAGGIPVIGDDGHFKVCLDPSAVIKYN